MINPSFTPAHQAPTLPAGSRSDVDWAAVEHEATRLLSRYLQFDTSNPPGAEAPAIAFLAQVLDRQAIPHQIIEAAPGRANLIARLPATGPARCLPCLLYAHADVVPAEAATWSVPPFAGRVQDGYVWGRGALDDKGLGIIFLQALILLKQKQVPRQRDIILLIAADEEAHGKYGVAWLLAHHPDLIQAEYVWDEGGMGLVYAAPAEQYLYNIAIAEKKPLTIRLTAHGSAGHAALPQYNSAQDRLVRALYRLSQWRRPARLTPPISQLLRNLAPTQPWPRSFLFAHPDQPLVWSLLRPILEDNSLFAALLRDTINLTMLHGGQVSNVVPGQAEAQLDVRLLPDQEPASFLAELGSLIVDPQVRLEAGEFPPAPPATPTDTDFYRAMAETLGQIGPAGVITPYLTPGATDSRYFRQAGMKAYGFMPMLLTTAELSRIHGVDERVSVANIRWGIQVVFETLSRLG